MSDLVGKPFPEGFHFNYVPYDEADQKDHLSCKIPIQLKLTPEYFKGKKVVITSAPGAFTPTCTLSHIPGYIEKASEFASKGAQVIVITQDSAFVNSAWGKLLGQKQPIEFASDYQATFSKSIGWVVDAGEMGTLTGRYTIIVDDGKVVYAEKEAGKDVTVSGADAALAKL
ncbi:Peroxiredoxin-1 [Wickerhamomyces ciferrii]|uniref:Peroxiredoxin-1 n=1 Tax=Wickerhamomyces ciferrii (strain ATCC 14091 / BCRC 22168 / CBS 111 / JCM 3599 / NBRC 0793 / NRRL Y-1031 F-60-10) TaxID=1206466 RepID=K0K7T9_WICCF|nr:Peroxiredoxin-1 [Wickerhamomyces ciferrii]CCH40880.1 Peroxiredoxin-1 [Wickerhamomyces ciferrii]